MLEMVFVDLMSKPNRQTVMISLNGVIWNTLGILRIRMMVTLMFIGLLKESEGCNLLPLANGIAIVLTQNQT